MGLRPTLPTLVGWDEVPPGTILRHSWWDFVPPYAVTAICAKGRSNSFYICWSIRDALYVTLTTGGGGLNRSHGETETVSPFEATRGQDLPTQLPLFSPVHNQRLDYSQCRSCS